VLGRGSSGVFCDGVGADMKETGSTTGSTDEASTPCLTGMDLKGTSATARGTDEAS
jgi:hypothetical protein